MHPTITLKTAQKVLKCVDAGLVRGVGKPIPGSMCVEAAVCYALGLPHGDDPQCVSRALRALKIRLNDSNWSSNEARAKGLRRLALAQLGSRDTLNDKEFIRRTIELATRLSVPFALRAVATLCKDPHLHASLLDAANRCEKEGTRESAQNAHSVASTVRKAAYAAAAYAADAAAYAASAASAAAYAAAYADAAASAASAAAYAAAADAAAAYTVKAGIEARDKHLSDFAEGVVQILIDMKAPGCEWLSLTDKP